MKDNLDQKREGRHHSDSGENINRFLPLNEFEVTCIRQEATTSGRYRISQLGVSLGYEIVVIDVPVAVFLIQAGKRFYVNHTGTKAYLRTMVSSNGHPYVETKEDGTHLNNLKSLPICNEAEQKKSEKDDPKPVPESELKVDAQDLSDPLPRSVLGWLVGAFGLLILFSLAILFSIVPVSNLPSEYFTITAFAILCLSFIGIFIFKKTSREVYKYYFRKRQSGWLGIISILLLFILLLVFLNPAVPVITFEPLPEKTYLDPDFSVLTIVSDGGTVSFEISLNSTCSLTKEGLVHILNAGSCAITAYRASNSHINAVTHVFTIHRKPQRLTLARIPDAVYGDPDYPLAVTADSALPVSFTASGACTSQGNSVHFLSSGSCTIAVNQSGNENYLPAQEITQQIFIAKRSQTIQFSGPRDQSLSQPFVPFSATASSGLPVSFTSADSSICTTDGNLVNIINTGICTISIGQSGNENYQAAPQVIQTYSIPEIRTAQKKDQAISFSPLPPTVFGSPDFALNASASSGLAVSFTASGRCSVTGASVKITGAGSCMITAHQDGNDFNNPAVPISQSLIIARATPVIFWENPDEIMVGTPLGPGQLFASAGAAVWNASHPYTFVSGTYTYTPSFGAVLSPGVHPLNVVFTPTDKDNYNGSEKTVSIIVVTSHEQE